jgi:hypothetical protein
MMTHNATIIANLPWFFAATGAGCLVALYTKRKKDQQKIRRLCAKIQTVLTDASPDEPTVSFAASLSQATMTTKLQQPRLQLQAGSTGEAPEKYKFFSNMVARGMNASEISEVLGISATEAAQLTRLCGVSDAGNL